MMAKAASTQSAMRSPSIRPSFAPNPDTSISLSTLPAAACSCFIARDSATDALRFTLPIFFDASASSLRTSRIFSLISLSSGERRA